MAFGGVRYRDQSELDALNKYGWNRFLNPETQRWEEIRHGTTGETVYQSVDFSPLAALHGFGRMTPPVIG
jgi:hypothetical protein